jgi:hypothetical protein
MDQSAANLGPPRVLRSPSRMSRLRGRATSRDTPCLIYGYPDAAYTFPTPAPP